MQPDRIGAAEASDTNRAELNDGVRGERVHVAWIGCRVASLGCVRLAGALNIQAAW